MQGEHKHPQFPIRCDRVLIAKLRYIAESNARSANREIELLIRKHVAAYESKHGEIKTPSPPETPQS